ncbi:MAG: hypothetical protein JWN34_4310, partial [Bryobacterales bacterium]|nr:hypothetical protein [Bryobacterales bacterium]
KNEDFAQCVLIDGNSTDARLNGVEYIVSERIFATLPEDEKKFWHPHNFEILSGQLIGPGLPDIAEKELMRRKVNSYGKTWHLWMTDSHGKAGDALPIGEPHLAWSFNRDGEADPGMLQGRDRRFGVDSNAKRKERSNFSNLARTQRGTELLAAPAPLQPAPPQ